MKRMEETTHASYRPDIDGLRAVAILLVIGFHAFPARVPGGFIGVDIFFVVSGFLISCIIFNDLRHELFSFKNFYIRRAKRIFPALIVVLSISLLLGWLVLFPDEYASLGKHVAAGAGFVSNLVLWGEVGYFDVSAEQKPMLHLWSLGVEEQFYLIMPFLLVMFWKFSQKPFLFLVTFLSISFLLNIWFIRTDPTVAFYFPFTRFWELLCGSVLAFISLFFDAHSVLARNSFLRKYQNKFFELAGYGGAMLIFLALIFIDGSSKFPGWWALLPTLGTALLISAGPGAWLNRNILSFRPMVLVGLISYPLYLWHWPLLSFVRILHGGEIVASWIRICIVILSIFLAWLTYRYVEQPIRFGMKIRAMPFILLACIAGAGFLGLQIIREHGFPFRTQLSEKEYQQNLQELIRPPSEDADCRSFVGLTNYYCRLRKEGTGETIALIGDSHAASFFDGLSEEFAVLRKNTVLLAQRGCPLFLGVVSGTTIADSKLCKEDTKAILSFLISRNDIHVVIIATRGPWYLSGKEAVIFHNISGSSSEPVEIFSQGLHDTVALLTQSGKKAYYILEVPGAGTDPRNCLKRPLEIPYFKNRNNCGVAKGDVLREQNLYRKIISSIKVTAIDTLPIFCPDNSCKIFEKGILLYADNNHLSIAGSKFIASKLARILFPQQKRL